MKKLKIVRIVTVPIAFVHIKAFLRYLKIRNAEVVLVSSKDKYEEVIREELDLKITPIEISREINILNDLKSLWALIKFFRSNDFDIIHSSTPKAGFLVALAGVFSPKSIRIHTFTGQRWATLNKSLRILLKFMDKVIIKLNDQCYADSFSQIEFLRSEGVVIGDSVRCLHKGSYGGIDCVRFDNDRFPEARREILQKLQLESDSILLLFVGRVTREKGIEELVKAFVMANDLNEKIKLIIVGPFEPKLDKVHTETLEIIKNNPSIFSLGFSSAPEKFFSGADIFCLPSYREGFGTVVLEAAACELLTLGTRIPGLVDSIVHGETGLLVDLHNIENLKNAIVTLSKDERARKRMSSNAKIRARRDFECGFLAAVQWDEYNKLIEKKLK